MQNNYLVKLILICIIITSCVYRPDLQQGNLLKIENIDRIELGMTKSQIRYLLGGPVMGNPYESDRWDYIYLYQNRMNAEPSADDQRYWLIVNFEDGKVTQIEKDVLTRPESN
jgi:outer membrane protein assembly factor BamE